MYGIYNPLFNTWHTKRGKVVLFPVKEQAVVYMSVPHRRAYFKPGVNIVKEYMGGKDNAQ